MKREYFFFRAGAYTTSATNAPRKIDVGVLCEGVIQALVLGFSEGTECACILDACVCPLGEAQQDQNRD